MITLLYALLIAVVVYVAFSAILHLAAWGLAIAVIIFAIGAIQGVIRGQ